MRGLIAAVCLAIGLAVLPPGPVQAEPADAALAQWLAGAEEPALTRLAALAADGDGRAQLALGLIDAEPLYHGSWLLALDRQARGKVLRQGGGLSGRSWLRDLADPPAPLWRSAWDGAAKARLVQEFLSAGEARAALVVALRLVNRQMRGFGALALEAASPGWLQVLAARDRAAAGQGALTLPPGLHPGDPAVQHLLGGPLPDSAALADWLARDPLAAPLRSHCQTLCPDAAADSCHLGLFQAIGGYPALARIRSPSPRLIGEDVFAASPLAQQMLGRLVADRDKNARRNRSDGPICSQ